MVTRFNDNGVMLINAEKRELDTMRGICTLYKWHGGKYDESGDYSCIVYFEKNSDDIKCIQIPDIGIVTQAKDRIIYDRKVYDVEDKINEMTMKVFENKVESSLRRFEDAGVTIEDGFRVPVKSKLSEEDAIFTDKWVGTWTRNICENYALLKNGRSMHELKNKLSGKPVIIVGAGPSLEKTINDLKGISAFKIVVDRAYKRCLAAGIEPDLVVSIDCHDDIILGYLNKTDSSKYTIVLNSAQDYKIAREWKGRVLYFSMAHSGMQFCDHILPTLFPHILGVANVGCVVNTAFIIATWMDASSIILTGCDFGYPGNRLSCDTYDIDNKGELYKVDINEEERFNKRTGKMIKNGIFTYPPFIGYMDTLKELVRIYKREVVNATEGGIIDCLPKMTLLEAAEKYCKQ